MKKLGLVIFTTLLTLFLVLILGNKYFASNDTPLEPNNENYISANISKENDVNVNTPDTNHIITVTPKPNYLSTKSYEENHTMSIIEVDKEIIYKTFESIGISIDSTKKYLNKEEFVYTIDEENLNSFLNELNENRYDRIYSTLQIKDNNIEATAYHDGNLLNIEALKKYILNNKENDNLEIILDNFLIEYEGSKPSELVKEYEKEIEKLKTFAIEYVNGEKIDIYNFLDFIEVIDNAFVFNFDSEEFNTYLNELITEKTNSYNTYYNDWDFITTSGEQIKISKNKRNFKSGVYGSKVDFEGETLYIKEKLLTLESEKERIPLLLVDNGFEIGNSYIEVSIDNQHVWLYKDGKLLMDSNCITGNYNDMDTPTGVYYIIDQCHHAYFSTGGYSYNWMKFTSSGHGLHDATWKTKKQFESIDTYKGKGSHGCVNLPLEFANELYNNVNEGYIVVIY